MGDLGPIDQLTILMEELSRRPKELGLFARAALARTFAVAKVTPAAVENEPWGNISIRKLLYPLFKRPERSVGTRQSINADSPQQPVGFAP